MRLALNIPLQIPRPLFLDETTGNMRSVDRAEYSVEPPGLAYIDAESYTATGLAAGEGKCTITAELDGVKLSKVVDVVVPAPQTVEVQVPVNVPGEPPPFVASKLIVPGE